MHVDARTTESPAAGILGLPALVPAADMERERLSPAQRGVWFMVQMHQQAARAYQWCLALRLSGVLDRAALCSALDLLLQRHEVLRTLVVEVDGQPGNRALPLELPRPVLEVIDLCDRPDPPQDVERIVAEEALAPVALERDGPTRFRLLATAETEHVLLWSIHHIATDGGSMLLLLQELAEAYAGCRDGRPTPPVSGALQYADYAAWLSREFTPTFLHAQRSYWTTALSGAPARLDLPLDRPRPPQQDYAGAAITGCFPAPLAARLKAMAKRQGTTLFVVMLSSWALLLARLSGQRDLVIGVATANRSRPETERMVGLFINLLPLRIDLGGNPSFLVLLDRVKAALDTARQHADISLEQIVEAVAPQRHAAFHPVFQSAFSWPRPPQHGLAMAGLEVTPVPMVNRRYGVPASAPGAAPTRSDAALIAFMPPAATQFSKFDVSPTFWEAEHGIVGNIDFATAILDAETVQRWFGHWQVLLEHIADETPAGIEEIPLLTAEEHRRLTGEWAAGPVSEDAFCSLDQRFARQAMRTPAAPALQQGDQRLSYGQLRALVVELAARLRLQGAGRESLIGIAADRSLATVVAILATLEAGAAFVPLDPAYPSERLAFMLADSGCGLLLHGQGAPCPWAGDLPRIEVVLSTVAPASLPHAWPGTERRPEDLAYILYTSGSSGTPKGVQIEHGALANLLVHLHHTIDIGAGDCWMQFASFSFDLSILELGAALTRGALLYLPAPGAILVGEILARELAYADATHAFLTPSVLGTLEVGQAPPRLRWLAAGAEALSAALARAWAAPHRTLMNGYGPTEATVMATSWLCPLASDAVPAIGRPLHHLRTYILDAHGAPQPVGVAGELHIGGIGLARGYVNRPELTAACFVQDPYVDADGARMYRSGDRVRWRADATIEFLGRMDQQLKLRGFRIEPGEIEAQIRREAAVSAVQVLARADASGVLQLVAYVVCPPDTDLDAMSRRLADVLPAHMLPAAWVPLAALPLTPNGKLDLQALPAPTSTPLARSTAASALTPMEQQIADIWRSLLRCDAIVATDHFFALGGHSLLAVQMVSRLREATGRTIPLAWVFEQPVLAVLARRLEASAPEDSTPLVAVPRTAALMPASFAQARLWFMAQLGSAASRAYTMPLCFELRGELQLGALRFALDRILARHESLRTTFLAPDGEPRQHIAAAHLSHFALGVEDWRESGASSDAVQQRLAALVDTAFDLRNGPLIRGHLLRLADELYVLLLTQHHILSDGWSQGVLIHELNVLYRAGCSGQPDPLPALLVQYADFAAWQQASISGARLQEQERWWARRLDGAPPVTTFPTDHPRPAVRDFSGAFQTFGFDAGLTAEIRSFAQRHDATLFMVLLASFCVLLARLSGQTDLVIGTPSANRGRRALEPLIGFFVNTVALRLDLEDTQSVAALVAQVREQALASLAHQDLPFQQVVDLVKAERSLAVGPLVQVMFAWQSAPRTALDLPGMTSRVLEAAEHSTATFDFSAHLWDYGQTIAGGVEYARALYAPQTIATWLEHWQTLLAAMVRNDTLPIARLPLLTPISRSQLLARFSAIPNVEVADQRLWTHVARHAQQQPDAIAVEQAGDRLSYAELHDWSRRLAQHLGASGVGKGDLVAVCLPRSLDLVVGQLAVLLLGAVYVPMDLSQPATRLQWILADATPKHVLGKPGLAPLLGIDPLQLIDPAALRSGERVEAPSTPVAGGDLAYVIYTSGSTGMPKGALIEHRGLENFIDWYVRSFELKAGERHPCFAGVAFDACLMEIWVAWRSGATLVLAPPDCAGDADRLLSWWQQDDFAVCFMTTALAELAFRQDRLNRGQRALLVGGEALRFRPPADFAPDFLNVYGPTECSIIMAGGQITPDTGVLHIGRPIQNTCVYLLDALGEPVPVGAIGELYVGGDCVGRGYLHRPELTAARFLPDPFRPGADGRMYRTGDLGRWLGSGDIELVGRTDHQVKLRGFRIELGEIETAIAAHPEVAEVVVKVEAGAEGDRRLVAWIAPSLSEVTERALQQEHIAHWHTLYQDIYADSDAAAQVDFIGWHSSYDNRPLPVVEMQEWRAATLARIAELRPRRVLEIGCGSGLLLLALAPDCETYLGTDFSAATLERLAQRVAAAGLANVELQQREADRFAGLTPGSFDTVIVNSVIQYFPHADYLHRVLVGALGLLAPGGALFVGDVRSRTLLPAFHADLAWHHLRAEDTPAAFWSRLQRDLQAERELLVAPEFFVRMQDAVGAVQHVRVLPKATQYANELSAYRYDVVLHLGPVATVTPQLKLDWDRDGLTPEGVASLLDHTDARSLLLTGIRNPLVSAAAVIVATLATTEGRTRRDLAEVRAQVLRAGRAPQVSVAALATLAGQHGFALEPSWIATDGEGRYHALLWRHGETVVPCAVSGAWLPAAGHDYEPELTNSPSRQSASGQLTARLRQHLKERLPDYMLPSQFVVLERLPQNANGKLDRNALTVPDEVRHQGDFVAPRSDAEIAVARIWAETLAVDRVGLYDEFFELGGHSLLAVQVISRLRSTLRREVDLGTLFAHPVLAGFARAIEDSRRSELPAITFADRRQPLPLSFAQQRLWFLCGMGPHISEAYHVPLGWRLHGPLDADALAEGFRRVIARHEALRTHFTVRDGVPEQQIVPAVDFGFTLPIEAVAATPLEDLLSQEARAPFDLGRGPLLRVRLLRIAPLEHVLLLTLHHILADGWSMGRLLHEVSHGYRGYRGSAAPALPLLPLQYADYAAWQRKLVSGELLQRQVEFWRGQLLGAPELTELPGDRPRPPVQDFVGELLEFQFDEALASAIHQACARHGATPYMVLLGSWLILVARLSGQRDLVVGSPTANRNLVEIEDLIGFFVNAIAVRVDLAGPLTAAEVIARVKTQVLAALQHQDLPFEQVVERLKPARSLAYPPVFQMMLAWQNAPESSWSLPGVEAAPLPTTLVKTKFDLILTLHEHAGRIEGVIGFASALYERATIVRYLSYWRTLLAALLADEDQDIGQLPLLDAPERQQLLDQSGAAAVASGSSGFLHEMFERQAAQQPQVAAVLCQTQRVSYAELNARANVLARHLRQLGAGRDVCIAISLPRGPAQILCVLAVLKSGSAYVPLDPAYPAERLRFMLEDCAPVVLLATPGADLPWATGVPVLGIDALDWSTAAADADLRRDENQLDDAALAYVIYTSGSTGRPKGVMVDHGALSGFAASLPQWLGDSRGARVAQCTSASFDVFLAEFAAALAHGGTLCIPPAGALIGSDVLAELVARHGISHAFLTPAVLSSLRDRRALAGVHTLVAGGEALSHALAAFWGEGRRLINGYGPTEATVFATVHPCHPLGTLAPPIGRPIAGSKVYVLDAHGAPVPAGVVGELYIGGTGLARGYLQQPELSRERFLPDPFAAAPGARMYRTGDLVRWLAGGVLEYCGRNDFQVKVRGYRIELNEIEQRLRELAGVDEAAVILRAAAEGEHQLVAYWVGRRADTGEAGAAVEPGPLWLRTQLLGVLPEFMVPAAFVRLDRLPVNQNGKLDRQALPAPLAAAYAQQAFELPEGEVEGFIAELWGELLGLDQGIGRHDNFFQLGGHSLLLLRAVWRMNQAGYPVTAAELFQHPTIERLAAWVVSAEQRQASPAPHIELRQGAWPPLFLLHDGSGLLVYAHRLADSLQTARALIGLPLMTPVDVDGCTVDALAERLLAVLQRVQPSGPYWIAGWSFGGLLAHAIAVRLLEQGEELAFVGLLDTLYHGTASPGMPSALEEKHHLLALCQVEVFGNPVLQQALEALHQVAHALDFDQLLARCRALQSALLPAHLVDLPAAQIQQYLARQHALHRAAHGYMARRSDVAVTLFRASDAVIDLPDMGWTGAAQVTIVDVPGSHYSMLRAPHLQILAGVLDTALREHAPR